MDLLHTVCFTDSQRYRQQGWGPGSVMVAVPSPSPKPPEWQMLVKECSDDTGTVWTGTIMLKDDSVAGSLGHHSKFQPINLDGQSFFAEELLCHVQIYNKIQAVAVAFNKGVRRYMNPCPYVVFMDVDWNVKCGLGNERSLHEELFNIATSRMISAWKSCHMPLSSCGMRAKTEACSHSVTKVPSTRCGHFSHSLIGFWIYLFFGLRRHLVQMPSTD